MSHRNMVSTLLPVLLAVLIAACDASPTSLTQSEDSVTPSPTEVAFECTVLIPYH